MMRLPSELVPTRPWEPAWWKVAPPMIKVDIPSGHVLLWRWPPAPNRGYGPSNPLEAAAPRRTGSRARTGAKFFGFPHEGPLQFREAPYYWNVTEMAHRRAS